MRPASLNPLFAEVSSVKGIGDKLAKLFAKLLRGDEQRPARLVDVLFHLPTHAIDRRFRCSISQLPQSGIATLEVVIGKHKPPPRGTRLPYKIEVHDDTGQMSLVFFAAHGEQMLRQFPEGQRRLISGEVSWFGTEAQISHPDYVLRLEEADKMPELEPVYPLTAGLSGKVFAKAVAAALEKLPQFDEWQDAAWLKSRGWMGFGAAFDQLAAHVAISQHAVGPVRATVGAHAGHSAAHGWPDQLAGARQGDWRDRHQWRGQDVARRTRRVRQPIRRRVAEPAPAHVPRTVTPVGTELRKS